MGGKMRFSRKLKVSGKIRRTFTHSAADLCYDRPLMNPLQRHGRRPAGRWILALPVLLFALALAGCEQGTPLILEDLTAVPPTPAAAATRPATATPPPPPAAGGPLPAATQEPEPLEEGIDLQMVPGVAGEASLIEIPGTAAADPRAQPAHFRFELRDYALPSPPLVPRLEAYPARAYASLNPAAVRVIAALQTLRESGENLPPDFAPPLLPAGEPPIFQARPAARAFQNGRGLRYLTMLVEESGRGLAYVFQGLTDDGSGYATAVLPVAVEGLDLPAGGDSAALEALSGRLDSLPDSAFTPGLAALDRLIASLRLHYPPPEATITADGRLPLTLFYPLDGGIGLVGHPLVVEGYVQPGEPRTLLITLAAGDSAVARTTIFSLIDGHFLAELPIPPTAGGLLVLRVETAGERLERDVVILPEGEAPLLTLARPAHGEIGVAGRPLYFAGRLPDLPAGQIEFGLLINGCTTFVTRQTAAFAEGDRTWQGMVVPPQMASGPVCALARIGTPGEEGWHEARARIRLVDRGDPAAPRIVLGNPAEMRYPAGKSARFFGSVTGDDGRVVLALISAEGERLAGGETTAGPDGAWTIDLEIPAGALGPATLVLALPGEPQAPPLEVAIVIEAGVD